MRTVFRFRPLTSNNNDIHNVNSSREYSELEIDSESNLVSIIKENGQQQEYQCDHIFNVNSCQAQVFESIGKRSIDNVIEGYNATIFAYGQTGSGKTYTMFGNTLCKESVGLSFRCIHYLFKLLCNNNDLKSYNVMISSLEIYNEQILDKFNNDKILKIMNNNVFGHTTIQTIESKDATQKILDAIKNRQVSSTKMNHQSSRSHLIITFEISQKFKTGVEITSKLNFVDLAGSERVGKTGVTGGKQLKEANNINKSLVCLGRVVDALAKKSKSNNNKIYIPYRDCTLTKLLQDSLGGNSFSTMVACASIEKRNISETISTLLFASRTRKIKNKPKINQKFDSKSYQLLKKHFEEYQSEAKNMIALLEQQNKNQLNNLNDTINELKNRINELEIENNKLINENKSLKSQLNNINIQTNSSSKVKKENEKEIKVVEKIIEVKVENKEKENELLEQFKLKEKEELERRKSLNKKLELKNKQINNLQNKINVQMEESKKKMELATRDLVDMKKLGNRFKDIMFLESIQRENLNDAKKIIDFIDVNTSDSNGETALHFCAKTGNVEILEWLLKEHNANPNVFDKDTISPSMVTVVYNNIKCLKLLISYGAYIDYQNALGCTCLHIASSRGLTNFVELLLSHTKNVNITSKRGWSALHFAAKAGFIDIVYLLVQNKSDINLINKANCTPLILSSYSGKFEVVSYLLERNADFNIRDKFGMTAHIWAQKKNYKHIATVLHAHGSRLTMKDKIRTIL